MSITHELGHRLDLITTRSSDNIIAACSCIGELFSDHFPVFSQIRSNRPQANVTHVQFRKMKSTDPNQFPEAISSSQLNHDPPNDLHSLFSCYNESLRPQLEMYALVLTRDINVRPLAAWFNEDIRNAKRLRLNAEKTWRAPRLSVDLAAFKKERNRVVNLMNETRRVYFNQFIEDNSTDQKRLFAVSKSLLNMRKDRSLYTFCFTSCKQYGSVFYCQGNQYQFKAKRHSCCQSPSPTWNLNLVILYFPTSNAKPD